MKRAPPAMGCPAARAWSRSLNLYKCSGQFTGKKIPFEEITDIRLAREVAKELGYKVD